MAELGAVAARPQLSAATGIRASSRFYVGIAAALLIVMIWGFTPSFYLRSLFTVHHSLDLSGTASMPLLLVLHGLVITAWFSLFFAQVLLAATGRISVHRQLGIATAIVAVLLVALTLPTMILSIPRFDHAHLPRELAARVVIGDSLTLVWFALFVGTAVWLRRRADVHKRLMLLASMAILVPAQARVGDRLGYPVVAIVGGTIALWLALAIHDFQSRKRLQSATAWGGFALVVAHPLLMAGLAALDAQYHVVDAMGRLAYAVTGGGGT